jgi:hypothetical protein
MRTLVLFFVVGCGSPPPEPLPGCNPLVGDDCLSPFPSQFYWTAAGVRIPSGVLPVQANGLPILPDRINQKPGFSPNTPFFVYFKGGVDPANFPDAATSVTPQSAVQVLRASDGTRVPVMAELDANALPGDRQALILRPLVPLQAGERYLLALVGLKDPAGRTIAPAPFRALRDRGALSHALSAISAEYEDVFSRLEKAGVPRSSLSLAWDVMIGGDDHLTAMRDQALSMTLGYTIVSVKDTPNDVNLLKRIEATVQAPMYLDENESFLHFDAAGRPAMRGLVDVPVIINVPRCATTPVPLVVFGHGLFLDRTAADSLRALTQKPCAVWAAADWWGLSTADIAPLAQQVAADLNNVYRVQDRLQQAMVNNLVVARLMLTKIKDDPALGGTLDGTRGYYYGISNGGIQGTGLMALSPDLSRGVLNVPGANWSLLIWRSTDFNGLKPLVTSALTDAFDAQIYIGLLQPEWDYVDPATFAPGLTTHKKILMQESIGDAQVSNLATRYLARAMGIVGLQPLVEPVYGVETQPAPLDSAYTQWNSHPMPLPPATNTSLPMDTWAHNAVWSSAKAQQQVEAFLREGGQVIDVCGGVPCDI